MHRVDTEGNAAGLFQDGTPQTGQQGTILGEDWFNDLQENVCRVIEVGAGAALIKGDYDQLRLAVASMIAAAAVDWNPTIDGARVKPGVIQMFGAPAAPAGYLECDGAAVSRVTFAALFAVIGTVHGPGDGVTTFNVPDLRGEFVRGWDDARGVDAARAFGSAQADALKAHTHSLPVFDDAGTGTFLEDAAGTGVVRAVSTGSTGDTETRPRNVALLFIIKT